MTYTDHHVDERRDAGRLDAGRHDARFGAAAPGAHPVPLAPAPVHRAGSAPPPRRLITKWRLLAAGVALLLAVGCYVAGYLTAPGAPQPRLLLVTTAQLPAGARLASGDLSLVRVAAGDDAPVGALSSTALASVIGLVTTTSLPRGTFLTRSVLANSGAVPGPAQALVGLALKPGQLPVGGLADGQPVLVVALPVNSSGVPLKAIPMGTTTIWDEEGPDTSGTTQVTVVVPATLAVRLAQFAAQGQVALVQTTAAAGGAS